MGCSSDESHILYVITSDYVFHKIALQQSIEQYPSFLVGYVFQQRLKFAF
jgi:hypothetical protein